MTSWPNRIATIGALALALCACDWRRDDAGQSPEEILGTPTPTTTSSPVASIIREDIVPPEEIELPTEPVNVTIPFPEGNDLNERAELILAQIVASDALEEDWPVIIGGHSDSSGNDEANLRASRARAEAVAAWLVERGLGDDRIEVIAFGEQNPIAPNALPDGTPNEQGRQTNRRVEVRIAPPRAIAAERSQSGENEAPISEVPAANAGARQERPARARLDDEGA